MTKFNANKLVSEFPIRVTKDGFHQYRNDYKKSSIQGTHVTFEEGCTHALTVAHVPMVLEDIHEKESDNLGKFIIDTRQRIDRRKGKMFRTYKDVSLTISASIHKEPPLVVEVTSENTEKESDKLTKSSERYNADEQADFTQTEAEEWATEI